MTEYTHYPNAPEPPPVLARIAVHAAAPTFADACTVIVAEYRGLASEAYHVGDQRQGDAFTAKSLAWELARQMCDLGVLQA